MTSCVGAFVAKYFDNSSTRFDNILQGYDIKPFSTIKSRMSSLSLVGQMSSFLINIHLSYLNLRLGYYQMIQLHSSDHFGKQFGFPHDILGMFKKIPSHGTLLKVYKYWGLCTRLQTNSIFTILYYHSHEKFLITKLMLISGSNCMIWKSA